MNTPASEPTHLPVEGAKLSPLGYFLSVSFHPPMKFATKDGLNLAASLSEYVDTQNVRLESNQWTYTSEKDSLNIILTNQSLQLHAVSPVREQEWYEGRYLTVLKRFEEQAAPELILESKAMVRGLLEIDGDAREFLGSHLMNMDPRKLRPMGRPLHILGMRLFFPPYIEQSTEKGLESAITEWGVNVKLESWIEDTSKLFIEADAGWCKPEPWNESVVNQVVGRLETLAGYLEAHVIPFLQLQTDEQDEGD